MSEIPPGASPPGPGWPGPPFYSDIGRFVIGYSPIEGFIYSLPSPGITQIIAAYLYWEYSDDDALQAFISSENAISQAYLDWFNTIDLPIYPSPTISGDLLDWVGAGLYGMPRPVIHSAVSPKLIGVMGTVEFGFALAFGKLHQIGPAIFFVTTDDIYKRILTWHFFKGDGKYFSLHWLKRRVYRFLIGVDGTAPRIDWCPQITILVAGGIGTIIIRQYLTVVTGGPIYGIRQFFFGAAYAFGTITKRFITLGPPLSEGNIFKAAVDAGVLELPFQYNWNVIVQGPPPL